MAYARRTVALTPANEALLRAIVLEEWFTYFAKQRRKRLSKGIRDDSRYLKREEPVDCSGACKMANSAAVQVFPLFGGIIQNPRHTFVVMDLTDKHAGFYDINRDCRDVQTMIAKDRVPYEVDLKYALSDEADALIKSWHNKVDLIVDRFLVKAAQLGLKRSTELIRRCPDWAAADERLVLTKESAAKKKKIVSRLPFYPTV